MIPNDWKYPQILCLLNIGVPLYLTMGWEKRKMVNGKDPKWALKAPVKVVWWSQLALMDTGTAFWHLSEIAGTHSR
jgi:hypothetical protein